MRNTAKGMNKAFAIGRVLILALCFAVVFTLTLCGTFGDIVSPSIDNVVYAAGEGDGGEEAEGAGVATPSTDITASAMGFPGTNGSKRSWTQTVSFNDFSKVLLFTKAFNGAASEDDPITSTNQSSGSTLKYYINCDTSQLYGYVGFSVQYGSFLNKLIMSDSKATVTAQVTGTMAGSFSNVQTWYNAHICFRALSSADSITSSNIDSLIAYDGDYELGKDDESISKTFSSTATLTKSSPKLLILFETCCKQGVQKNLKLTTTITNLQVKFTVTLPNSWTDDANVSIDDGAAPKIGNYSNAYPYRTSSSSTTPAWYLAPATNGKNDVFMQDVFTEYNKSLDSYTNGNGNVKLHSYTNTPISGQTYYKTISVSFTDYYNYNYSGTDVTAGSTYSPYFSAGLKEIHVGDYDAADANSYQNIFGMSGTSGAKTFKVEGVSVGTYTVTKTDRNTVTVNLYIEKNCNIVVQAYDFGGKTSPAVQIDVRGIDKTKPNGALEVVSSENYVSTTKDWNSINWYHDGLFVVDLKQNEELASVENDDEYGCTPYAWFYTVKKVNSPSGALTPDIITSASTLKNMVPFTVGEADTFTYDFKTGYAMPQYDASGAVLKGIQQSSSATGCGYYLFTFYTMDLAGNYVSSENNISYYVKADYDLPVYTVSKSVNDIGLASNASWGTTGELKVQIDQSVVSISGNVISFVDPNSNDVSIAVRDGGVVAVNTKSSYSVEGNVVSIGGLDRKGRKDGSLMTVDYVVSGSRAYWTLTFSIETIEGAEGEYLLLDYLTDINLMVGSSFAPYIETIYSINNYDDEYKNGVYIRSDRNAPDAPFISDTDANAEKAYVVEISEDNYLSIPALSGRSWFTSGWTMPAVLTFIESGLDTYGADINVFIAMKNVKTIDDFTITGGKNSVAQFVSDFATGYGNISDYNFTKVVSYTGDKLDEVTNITLDLVESDNAGMRVFFVWAVDQAGNRSELSFAYVLADANQYYATAYADNSYFGNKASVLTGGTRARYSRGGEANFVFSLADGFAPYRLEYRLPGEDATVLWEVDESNATSTIQSYSDDFVTVTGTDFTIKLDAGDDLGILKNNNGDVSVYFVYREIITFAVTNQNVYYSGAPTDIPMSLNDYDAKAYVKYNFKDRDTSAELGFVPTEIGNFKVDIEFNDEHYISQKVVDMNYSIIPARVTVSAIAGSGEFGKEHSLEFAIDGLVGDDFNDWDAENGVYSGTTLTIPAFADALSLEGTAPYTDLAIGAYPISINQGLFDFGDNYDVKFVAANYVVTVKYINVSIKSAEKTFGNNDPAFEVTVDLVEEEIEQSQIINIFKNVTLSGMSGNIATLKGNGVQLLMRNAGEDVGTYAFSDNASAFEMDENYGVVISRSGSMFTINKLTINVSVVADQEFAYNEAGDYQIALQMDNAKYASLYTKTATIGAEMGSPTTSGNYKNYVYAVVGQDLSTANIDFVFDTTGTIKVKQWTDTTLPVFIITAKQNFTLNYGDAWNSEFRYDNYVDMFDLTSKNPDDLEIPEGYSLRWTATLSTSKDGFGFHPAGTYTVRISDVKVYNERNIEDTSYTLIVSAYQVTILPVEIEIVPVVTVGTKEYGAAENTYQIGFDVENVPENIKSAVDKDMFSGSFVRAIYGKNNNAFVSYGSQFDFATDENGLFDQDGVQYYYGAAVSNAFVCSENANFIPVVKDSALKQSYFFITPAEITLDDSIFQSIGKDKDYDGSSFVKYTDSELKTLINIGQQLKRGTDDVFVTFTANYSDAEVGDNKSITFTNIGLGGAYAVNYVLVGCDEEYVTEARFSIFAAPTVLTRNFFDITKVYDGTKELNASHIKIDEDCALFGTPFKVITKGLSFESANVTYNFATSIELFFPGISASFVLDEENSDEKISVETGYMYDGEYGLKVTILDLSGSITPKVVTINDITDVVAFGRNYNGYSAITAMYEVRGGIIQEGDTLASLGFIISAFACDELGNAIADAGIHNVRFDNVIPAVGANYVASFTADELNAKFDYLLVTIDRARLVLNLDFADDKQYAGNKPENQKVQSTDYTVGTTSDFVLYGEDAVGFNEEVWANDALNINANSFELYYTIDGEDNASVAVDKDGNTLKHNIRVSGLSINCDSSITDNYAVLAYEFDGEKYVEIARDIDNEIITLADFEVIEIATLNKKQLTPDMSGITVEDKIYDGTKNATVTMGDVTKIGVIAEEKDFVEVVFIGFFESKDYSGDGKTTKVSINISGLKNTEAAGDVDYTANYTIVGSLPCTARRTIKQAPIAVNIKLASKTYDGTNVVPDANIKAEFADMSKIYPAETDSYYVDYKFACYDGANVDEVTTGKVYGMDIIKTSNNSTINYKLVYADNDNTDALTETGNLPTVDADGNAIYYHDLPTIDCYVLTEAQYNKYGTPAYVGTYVRMGQKYYVIGYDTPAPGSPLTEEVPVTTMKVFENAEASIAPKQIKLSVIKKEGTTAFTKAYDGTNKFEGEVNVDYAIEKTSAFANDDADYIALDSNEVSAKFLRTSAGKTSVEFSFTENVLKAAEGIAADKEVIFKNYSCTSAVVLLSGEITKLQITSLLENSTITYGEVPASFDDKISYSVSNGANDYALAIVGGKAYLAEADYDVFFANYLATFADDDAKEAAKLAKLYELVDGEYVFAENGREAGKSYFIVLDGSFVVPAVSHNVSVASKVGTYSYKLVGGSATDYVFVNAYEGGADSATLTVEKADLIVRVKGSTEGYAYSKYFSYASPAIEFEFEGFKNNDGSALVSGIAAEFRLFEDGTPSDVAIDNNAEISSLLAENQYYAAYITNAGTALNYNVVADNSKIVKLAISIEPITGVKFANKTVAYNGLGRAAEIVPANVPVGATITYKYFDGDNEIEAKDLVNAGTYSVEATVVKSFDGNENHNSTAVFTANLTITQISFTMKFAQAGKNYDKKAATFDVAKDVILYGVVESDKESIFAALKEGLTVYAKNAKGEYVAKSSIIDADAYKIEFAFDSAYNKNYKSFTYTTTYTIYPVEVIVTLPQQYKRQLVDEENGNDIDGLFEYEIAEAFASKFSVDDIDDTKFAIKYEYLDDTKMKWVSYDEIFGLVGTYPYELTYGNKNFKLVGDNVGALIVGSNVITNPVSDKDPTIRVSATMIDDFINAPNVFIEYSDITSSSDANYWKNVKAYMPGLADKYHSTTLSSIVGLKIADYLGNHYDLPSTVEMEVAIPSKTKKLENFQVYYVNKEGGLSALNDYTVEKGKLKYTTDYLSTLVFVQVDGVNVIELMDYEIPYWLLGVVAGVAALLIVGIVLGAVFGAKAAKKKKANNMALETAGAGEAAPEVPETPAEEPTPEPEQPAEEPTPEPEQPAEEPAPETPAEEPVQEPEVPEEPAPEPAPEPEAPAPRVRPAKPTHVGKKKPPVIGVKDPSTLNDRSISAAPQDVPAPEAPAPETPAPEAPSKKVPPVVGKKHE